MKTLRWTTVALLTAVSLTATAIPGWAEAPTRSPKESDTTTIIVTVESGTSDPTRVAASAVAAEHATVTRAVSIGPNTVAVTMKNGGGVQAQSVSDHAEARSHIVAADVSRRVYATTTNDTYYNSLWNIKNGASSTYGTQAEDAWPTSRGAGAVIGVIDTGITNHSDLNANVITGYDFVSYSNVDNGSDGDGWDPNPADEGDWETDPSSWHGTHVAGIAAAIAGNAKGVAGVAPAAYIEPIRVLGWQGGLDSDIIAGVYWGAGVPISGVPTNRNPADVLNLSLGGPGSCTTAMQNAINAAVSRGTTVVVAAGNGDAAGNPLPIDNTFPANCANVIRVTATDSAGAKASWSNYGTASYPATVAAPGVDILSSVNAGLMRPTSESYGTMSGTSMAAPHVSGIIALLRSADANLTTAQLRTILTTHTTPITCSTTQCGAGVVNAANAVAQLTAPTISSVAVSGTPVVAHTLAAVTRSSTHPAYLKYQWLRNGVAIGGATRSTYLVTGSDVLRTISVRVTATVGSLTPATRTSAATAIRYGTFTKVKSPSVRGTMKVGRKLTAYRGSWSPSPMAYRYQWLRNGHKIKKATKSSYRLTRKDRGAKISVRVTVKRTYYVSRTVTSAKRRAR